MNNTYEPPRCRLSHPSLPHTLSIRRGRNPTDNSGYSFDDASEDTKLFFYKEDRHYYCTHCDVAFHNDSYTSHPKKTTHPYHLQHPLTLTLRTEMQSGSTPSIPDSSSSDLGMSESNIIFDKCTWCGKDLGEEFYHCSICSFSLDITCSKQDPLLTIPNPKSHHHSLFFLPRPLSVPCDACGLVDNSEASYACFQCNYFVHLSCTYLPRVIKITRHLHRLFYTPYLPPANWLCRVCYKTIDFKYGQYSCNQEDCSYVVHSKCATHHRVWDQKELEWKPEVLHDPKAIAPFVKVGDGLIKYFGHKYHNLRLEKYDRVRDARKQCQACVLPIDSRDFYNCEECYFCLHEVCAGLPRKLDHALHPHTLVLRPYTDAFEGHYHKMKCSTCSRRSTGFRYKCSERNCSKRIVDQDDFFQDNYYHIDLRCILVPEYFTHKSHAHPLFIAMSDDDNKIYCKVCKKKCKEYYLQCTKCEEFGMCYRCATIPHEVDYKYDNHPLTLCYGEENVDGTYWCEVCEKILDPTKWFYTCNKCCITIHRECLFGASVYMKLGSTFYCDKKKVNVTACVGNNRPICEQCNNRCPDSVCYIIASRGPMFWCSLKCVAQA
ncbi:hypothetical protein AALP_AA3G148500 [Arabis alpina]|uniref:Zinc finger PHD-type domain-containing protein n=1 Tax=Arabis alpina TaxID=50452 RepID=A0A087H997_ARAAL|nr:hypothetical protein AALP_AA3G148500 [Arabis alpina]